MVYLAWLLDVMTDRLKIVRIRARNVPRTRTQAPRRRRVSRISLSLQEATVSRADAPGCRPVNTFKKSSPDNLCMSGSGLTTDIQEAFVARFATS